MLRSALVLIAAAAALPAAGQDCAGAQVLTNDAFLHGRFETRMRSASGSGIVSSFFLYNLDLGCNWPAENNEIDVEMTGNRSDSVQFTTHYPGPWSATEIVPVGFNPHAGLHEYAIEWEPGIVRWFVDGELVYVQDEGFVAGLMYPLRLMMNLWAADAPGWVGPWDPSVMPRYSVYDYVRVYDYTPGTGNAGTDNRFTLRWEEHFDELDPQRWTVTEFGGFGGNFCTFVSNNVQTFGGQLALSITDPLASTSSPVHFSVDATSLDLQPSDVIYLNGEFNDWCGVCNPMTDGDGDGIWELTISLPAGAHQYLYVKNFWQELGGPPLNSACDLPPCNDYANYRVDVPHGSGPVTTPTYCWGGCGLCGNLDGDADGVPDSVDNCTLVANNAQRDTDGDGIGNPCDADIRVPNDCVVNVLDLGTLKAAFFGTPAAGNWNPDADFNGDDVVNAIDLGIQKSRFYQPPGPSALPNACAP